MAFSPIPAAPTFPTTRGLLWEFGLRFQQYTFGTELFQEKSQTTHYSGSLPPGKWLEYGDQEMMPY
jgi:hypothetical protein